MRVAPGVERDLATIWPTKVGMPTDAPRSDPPSDWQRRYDASVARQRERDAADPDAGLIEASSWVGAVPGWAGLVLGGLGAAALGLRAWLRRRRTARSEG